jgi:hypothetical protein
MTREGLEAEISELTRQIKPLADRRVTLRKMLHGPRVRVVAHFVRYGSEETDEFDSVSDAFGYLDAGEDYGSFVADGVTVGGAYVDRSEEVVVG